MGGIRLDEIRCEVYDDSEVFWILGGTLGGN